MTVMAAPSYLERHGTPRHPRELRRHNCLVFGRLRHAHNWRFARGSEDVVVPVGGNIQCDQGDTLVEPSCVRAATATPTRLGATVHPTPHRLRQECQHTSQEPVIRRVREKGNKAPPAPTRVSGPTGPRRCPRGFRR
jgi:hypothetical protein